MVISGGMILRAIALDVQTEDVQHVMVQENEIN